jgi:hypothetical protein
MWAAGSVASISLNEDEAMGKLILETMSTSSNPSVLKYCQRAIQMVAPDSEAARKAKSEESFEDPVAAIRRRRLELTRGATALKTTVSAPSISVGQDQ